MALRARVRNWLRSRRHWMTFQEWNREGWRAAHRRWAVQKQILPTPPMRTSRSGPTEIRVLTWRRDWVNLIWALKSFYHFSGVDYPLFIHDGGLCRARPRSSSTTSPTPRS